ncbi:MAG: hypothetical protein ABIH42_06695 [Planctomycetota bacterium]
MYNLSDDALEKLGMNSDLTEKSAESPVEEEKKFDEDGKEIIMEYDENDLGFNIGTAFLNKSTKEEKETLPADDKLGKSDKSKKTPEKEQLSSKESDKDSNKDTDKENPQETETSKEETEQPEGEEEEKTYKDLAYEQIKEFIPDFETEKELRDYIESAKAGKNFTASATKKSQELAEERKQFENFVDTIGGNKIQDAIEAVTSLDDLDDILEQLDDWHEGKENNKFRTLIDVLSEKSKGITKHIEQKSALDEEKANLELEKEILAVQRLDSTYQDTQKLQELGNLADKYGVDLATAHELIQSNQRAARAKELEAEKETLSNELKEVKSELKKRNAELTKAKAKIPKMDTGASGKGATEYDFSTPSSGPDETEKRVRKMLGVEEY